MRVRFADDVLSAPEAWHSLDRMVDAFLDGRHIWDVEDPGVIELSPWITSEPQSRATRRSLEAVEKILTASLYEPAEAPRTMHSICIRVSLVASPPLTLRPEEAARALVAQAYVVVENGESDRAFLDSMIRVFDREGLRKSLAPPSPGWKVISAGGCGEIPKRVRELVSDFGLGPRRIVVLSDSDRMHPAAELPDPIKKIETCGRELGIEVFVLRKREIENYLPVGALERVPRIKKAVYHAFLRLNPDQQAHYDMKSGFKDERAVRPKFSVLRAEPIAKRRHGRRPSPRTPSIPEAQADLFKHVQPKVLRDLCGGFGDEVWKYFHTAADVITAEAMRAACGADRGEIERLLDTIERLL